MKKLFKMTPLEDSFSCNFNILIAGSPRVMGVKEIISEWVAFREECVRRRIFHKLAKAKDKLHILKGLEKILLDIDKAIKIVRETDEEAQVVPNLMIGFGIDEIQAEYVAEIRAMLDNAGIIWQTGELGRIDAGGGGTVAAYMANRNIVTVDAGVPVLSMHAPLELVSKLDCYETMLACKAIYLA